MVMPFWCVLAPGIERDLRHYRGTGCATLLCEPPHTDALCLLIRSSHDRRGYRPTYILREVMKWRQS
jgi:hypothetical protein